MAARAGLHANQTRFEPAEEQQQLRAAKLPAQHDLAAFVYAVTWNTLFATSIPLVVIFMTDSPLLVYWT